MFNSDFPYGDLNIDRIVGPAKMMYANVQVKSADYGTL